MERQLPSLNELDAIGRSEAWRAGLAVVEDAAAHANEMGNLKRIANAVNTLGAVGWWSP